MRALLLILISLKAASNEYQLELAQNQTTMEWLGVSHAAYNYKLKTLGLIYYHDNNYGIRISYGSARATLPESGAAHPDLVIKLKHAVDFELLHRHEILKDFYLIAGVGHFADNFPIRKDGVEIKNDWDRGLGYSLGLQHKLSDRLSIQYTYRERPDVGPSRLNNGALGSRHKSLGVSISYTF
jgi:opacity protein-like surface antigen